MGVLFEKEAASHMTVAKRVSRSEKNSSSLAGPLALQIEGILAE